MYDYEDEKQDLFTADGQRLFLRVRDCANKLLASSGAIRMEEAILGFFGVSWKLMACIDRMVELGELRELTDKKTIAGQDRVFVAARRKDD